MSGYIGLEGIDGSGKTTVAAALERLLAADGTEVVLVREPGGTWLGEEVRRLLLHSQEMTPWAEAALFAAQRAQLAAEVIAPALERGAWVVSDRTYYSSLAYQGAARGLGVERVRAINEAVLGGVVPDIVAVLVVEPEIALARQMDPDRIGSTGVDFQSRVSDAYRSLAETEPGRVRLIPTDGGVDEITRRILDLVAVER